MSILRNVEQEIIKKFQENNIPITKLILNKSNRKELGDYQINEAMPLAKVLHKNPIEIAKDMEDVLNSIGIFENINIAGAGFINLTFKKEFLIDAMNKLEDDEKKDIDILSKEKIIIDYGGANIAKTLHVGHLRSANIGEALKRLARHLGKEVISDVHFGDIGRQSGMVIYELKQRYPNLNYFHKTTPEEWDELPITGKDLEEIYPLASTKAKENEQIMEEVRKITAELESGHVGYTALWDKIKQLSIKDIKNIYKRLNTDFELWEGESDCYPYIGPMLEKLEKQGSLTLSEGAKVIEVKQEEDKAPMPALVVVKNNGATLYATRELATLESRMKRFEPDQIWYLTDIRQELYFTQVFRAAYQTKIVPETTKLSFFGFGTMNGIDGKPFKTRDGATATLTSLLNSVKEEILSKMDKIKEQEKEEIAEKIMIAAVKYADFLPNRITDYIFDSSKFIDIEGKTGPYLLYSTVRMKSLLKKAENTNTPYLKVITDNLSKEVILLLLDKAKILAKAYENKELNGIADYLYNLTSTYNHFYEQNHILTEKDDKIRESWLSITKLVYETNIELLTILGIEVPEKM